MKWHSPAWRLPGGGGLLARGMEEVWGVGELRALIVLASAQPLVSRVTSRDHLPHRLFLSPPGRWQWWWWWLWVVFVEVDSVPSGAEFGALGRCEPSLGDQVPLGEEKNSILQPVLKGGQPRSPWTAGQSDQSPRGGAPPVLGLAGVGPRPQVHLGAAGRQGGGQARTHCTVLTRWPLTNDSLSRVTGARVPWDIMASFVQTGAIQSPESLSQNPPRTAPPPPPFCLARRGGFLPPRRGCPGALPSVPSAPSAPRAGPAPLACSSFSPLQEAPPGAVTDMHLGAETDGPLG